MKGGHDEFALDWTNRSFTSSLRHREWNIIFWFLSLHFFMAVASELLKRNFCALKGGSWISISSFILMHSHEKERRRSWVNVRVRHKNFKWGSKNVLLHNKGNRNAQWIKSSRLWKWFPLTTFFLIASSLGRRISYQAMRSSEQAKNESWWMENTGADKCRRKMGTIPC